MLILPVNDLQMVARCFRMKLALVALMLSMFRYFTYDFEP